MGGHLGDRRVRERTLYVASPVPDSAALAVPAAPAVAATPVATSPSVSPGGQNSVRIERALRILEPSQLLRIGGDFGHSGEFEGFVATAGPGGLKGLRPSRSEDWTTPWPQELGWDRIGRIERRGNSAGRGALVGGLPLATLGFIIGLAAVAASDPTGGETTASLEVVGGGLAGAVIAGSVGAAVGGLIGCAIPRWHVVY